MTTSPTVPIYQSTNLPPTNPYVGPRTFSAEQRHLFFGREREARDLLARVLSERLLLFYAQSGAGKSSLLHARLIPLLQEEKGFVVLPVGRVSGELPAGVGQVDNIFVFNLLLSVDEGGEPELLAQVSLGDFLARLARRSVVDADGQERKGWVYDPDLPPIPASAAPGARRYALIVDQFEEIITSHPARWREREDFFRQVDAALAADPTLWVVLTLREDYVAALDPYAELCFNRLRARFYMERMDGAAALEAIRRPAELGGRPFAAGVAEQLVDNLRQVRVPGQETTVAGQYVEPVQLQVVCYQLWEKLHVTSGWLQVADGGWDVRSMIDPEAAIQPASLLITETDLSEAGNVDQALTAFYEETLAAALADPAALGVSERKVRAWFDGELITAAGTRGLVHQGEAATDGLPNGVVHALQRRFLLRGEARGSDLWIELVHDRFVEPIRASNAAWYPVHLSALQRQAALWDEQGRPDGLLFAGAMLVEAEQWVDRQAGSLERYEEEFLMACRRMQEQAAKEERQNKRIKRLALGLAILAGIAVVASTLAWQNTMRAERQSELAWSRELAAAAITNLSQDPELSLLLALKAIDIAHTLEGEDALRQALQSARVMKRFTSDSPQTQGIQRAAFSPSGSLLASVTENGWVGMWEREQLTQVELSYSGEDLRPWSRASTSDARAYDLAYSPDGELLATALGDGTARLWDARTGEQIAVLAASLSERLPGVYSVAFSPDGRTVATAGQDRVVRFWDATNPQQPTLELTGHRGDVLDIVFATAAAQVATASADGTVKIWDNATGAELRSWQAHHEPVYAVDIGPDGRLLATGSQDKTAVIWDIQGSQPVKLQTLFDHTNSISDVRFSPNGACLATASSDRTAKLWDARTGELLLNLSGSDDWVTSVAFNPMDVPSADENGPFRCGNELATSSKDGVVRVWNIGPSHEDQLFLGHTGPVESAIFSPDGRIVATASDDGTARLWDVNTGRQLLVLPHHEARVNRVAFAPDGKVIATASWDGTAGLYDSMSGQLQALLAELGGQAIHSVAFSPDGKLVATASESGNVILWDVSTGRSLHTWPHRAVMHGVAFSPDEVGLAATGSNGQIRIYDVVSGELLLSLAQGAQTVHDAAFSPDGKLLATASWDGTTQLWQMPSGEPLHTLRGHRDRLYGVQFSPDGRLLATSSSDRTIRLWDVATGKVVRTLPGPEFNSLQFSPDGRSLVVGGEDTTARIYTLDLSRLMATARGRLTRSWTMDECAQYLHNDQCVTDED